MTETPAKTIVRREPKSNLSSVNSAAPGSLHPLLQRIYENRGIEHLGELDTSLAQLHPQALLKDIDRAAHILLAAIQDKKSILIVGDYDTDGATASAVAILGLRLLGAESVDYLVPNRFDYGYGLSEGIAKVALKQKPDVVVTVDNGISSVAGVALLREAGIEVVVTDHHLAGDTLPNASAIVNPNQPGCEFPSKMLAGVGVMFYVLLALRGVMREQGLFESKGIKPPNLASLLDLVALGTVADVVPLDHNNRILVTQGIARMQSGQCRPGIQSLLTVAGKHYADVASSDLGFVVAPRLNAAGRIDDIGMGIECLLADDAKSAMEYASALHDINLERRNIEQTMQQEALEIVRGMSAEMDGALGQDIGICLYNDQWHQGISGLVASRIKDRFHQPTIVFANSGDGNLTGSGRSISGLHIRDLLERISTQNPGLIIKFGGHAMAAGLTIAEQDYEQFQMAFKQGVSAHFAHQPPQHKIYTDGALPEEFFTMEVATMLRSAASWGQQFAAPLFDNEFRVIDQRIVGGQHLKFKLRARDRTVEAIAFRQLEPGAPAPKLERIRAVFQLDINEFRGARSLQLIIEHLVPCE